MNSLISKINSLKKSPINRIINQRLKDFSDFQNHSNEIWFSELCFCILAANSKQKTAEKIEKQLSIKKIESITEKQLAKLIKNNKHRFHNNKAKFIKEAMKFKNIKTIPAQQENKREFLVNNIKGLGFKESSHFLRNTGTTDLAILDRHIINTLTEHKIIEKPRSLTKNKYLKIEKIFQNIAKKLNMSPAKLDLYMWYLKTGEVLK